MRKDIYLGDCLDVMKSIDSSSIDMILCDMPYGTTQNKWDSVIDISRLWTEYRRLIKDNSPIVLTAVQPFASTIITAAIDIFKWEDIWYKSHSTGHLNCKIMPLRQHENILVFGKGRIKYNPQMSTKPEKDIRPVSDRSSTDNYNKFHGDAPRSIEKDISYPRSVIKVNNCNTGERGLHPTQKPIALFEYLIKTYTNSGDTVLDNCAGSGTTAIACLNLGRGYICIEKHLPYFDVMNNRINQYLNP